jgi:hypothetical protein
MNTHGINEAAINETRLDVTVRVAVNVLAYALTAVKPRALCRTALDSTAKAQPAVTARTKLVAAVGASAAALVAAVPRAIHSAVVPALASAAATVLRPAVQIAIAAAAAAQILVVARRVQRTPLGAAGLAQAGVNAVRRTGDVVTAMTAAQIQALLTAKVSFTVDVIALADIDASPGTVKRVQFDEYAVDAQTLVVRFSDNVFYVR